MIRAMQTVENIRALLAHLKAAAKSPGIRNQMSGEIYAFPDDIIGFKWDALDIGTKS